MEHPDQLKMLYSNGHDMTITNGISRIGYMKGGESALWRDEDIADILVDKAINFMDENSDKPFFIYYSPVDIHVPRIVHERFEGVTPFGDRKSTRLNSSHVASSYAVFCLKKRR